MPAQASWYQRVPEIVAHLRAPTAPPFLDRPAIENLFRLRRRQAIRLMSACDGYQVGKTYLVDRTSLLRFLNQVTCDGVVHEALQRKRRIREALDESANFAAAQQTRIEIDSAASRRLLEALSPAIEIISPGKLQISYQGATDLLAQIAEIAAAAANDFPRFQRIVERRK